MRDSQAKARGIAYEKKKRKKPAHQLQEQPQQYQSTDELNFIVRSDDGFVVNNNGHVFQRGFHGQGHEVSEINEGLVMLGSSDGGRPMIPLSVLN